MLLSQVTTERAQKFGYRPRPRRSGQTGPGHPFAHALTTDAPADPRWAITSLSLPPRSPRILTSHREDGLTHPARTDGGDVRRR